MPRIDGSLATVLAERRHGRDMVRLMVAMNAVDTLHRPLMLAMDDGYAEEFGHVSTRGDTIILLSLLVNALREAMEAYWEVEDIADELFNYVRLEDIYAEFVRFKGEADRRNPGSFYRRLIEPVPSSLALRWDRSAADNTLSLMGPVPGALMMAEESKAGRHISRFPLADEVYARTMLGVMSAPQLRAAITEVREFTGLFSRVMEQLAALFLRALGCRTVEAA